MSRYHPNRSELLTLANKILIATDQQVQEVNRMATEQGVAPLLLKDANGQFLMTPLLLTQALNANTIAHLG
jgi:hypothetical protein